MQADPVTVRLEGLRAMRHMLLGLMGVPPAVMRDIASPQWKLAYHLVDAVRLGTARGDYTFSDVAAVLRAVTKNDTGGPVWRELRRRPALDGDAAGFAEALAARFQLVDTVHAPLLARALVDVCAQYLHPEDLAQLLAWARDNDADRLAR